ncbi:hypothetical protein R3P38DRAFT_3169310 [Favolaschia claudopus]|uniref:Uncharacterized protein n=1 Tax=Favolaschia claudopus TaxID=2862362 RepID=A0AAW0E0V1_9AGAR
MRSVTPWGGLTTLRLLTGRKWRLPNRDWNRRSLEVFLLTPPLSMDELWLILEPAVRRRALKHLTIMEGFVPNRNGILSLRIGIDATTWLSEPNITLNDICCRLCRIFGLSVTAVFFFDVPATRHPLAGPFHSLVQAFGFYSRLAEGDIVIELACLNRTGALDLIFTIEAEAFVLGATHVVYSPQEDDYSEAAIYTSKNIHKCTYLSRGGLLLFCLLMGGRYNDGLAGCTESIAYTLALCGLGDTLLLAAQTLSPPELAAYLILWRPELREELVRANKTSEIIADVSDAFPDINTVHLYVALWIPRAPDLTSLRRLWGRYFQWRSVASIPSGFLIAFITAICVRRLSEVCYCYSRILFYTSKESIFFEPCNEMELLQAHLLQDMVNEAIPPLSSFLSICGRSRTAFKVEVFVAPIVAAFCEGTGPPSAKIRITIPRQILSHALPLLVQHYEKHSPAHLETRSEYYRPILDSTPYEAPDTRHPCNERPRRFGSKVYSGALIHTLKAHLASFPLPATGWNGDLRPLVEGIIQEGKVEDKENTHSTL